MAIENKNPCPFALFINFFVLDEKSIFICALTRSNMDDANRFCTFFESVCGIAACSYEPEI